MALFKVNRGSEENLPLVMNDGWAYFCTNSGNFYIDWADENGNLTRSQINAGVAEKLRYTDNGEYVEIDVTAISDMISKVHQHENMNVLNEITEDDVSAWNGKSKIYFSEAQPAQLKVNDLWFEVAQLSEIIGPVFAAENGILNIQ